MAGGASGRPPCFHSLGRLLPGEGQPPLLGQGQKAEELFLQCRPASGGGPGGQGKEPEQRPGSEAGLRQSPQVQAAERAVQHFRGRDAVFGGQRRQLLLNEAEARRLVGDKVTAAEHALVQSLQQVLGTQGGISAALGQQKFSRGPEVVHGVPRFRRLYFLYYTAWSGVQVKR